MSERIIRINLNDIKLRRGTWSACYLQILSEKMSFDPKYFTLYTNCEYVIQKYYVTPFGYDGYYVIISLLNMGCDIDKIIDFYRSQFGGEGIANFLTHNKDLLINHTNRSIIYNSFLVQCSMFGKSLLIRWLQERNSYPEIKEQLRLFANVLQNKCFGSDLRVKKICFCAIYHLVERVVCDLSKLDKIVYRLLTFGRSIVKVT